MGFRGNSYIWLCSHDTGLLLARTKTIRYYQIGLLFAHKDEAGLPACRRLKIGNRRRLHAGKKLGCAD